MKIRISTNGRTLYLAELVTLFRCEGLRGRADPAPSVADALTVQLELGERDLVLEARGLEKGRSLVGRERRLEILTPAKLPTDGLSD